MIDEAYSISKDTKHQRYCCMSLFAGGVGGGGGARESTDRQSVKNRARAPGSISKVLPLQAAPGPSG